MYNSDLPTRAELPSPRQLVRSTLLALIAAIVILLTIVLPAEYGIDPTGIGGAMGLTEMGEIKMQLAEEAEADRHHHETEAGSAGDQVMFIDQVIGFFFASAHAEAEGAVETSDDALGTLVQNEDEFVVSLAPGEYFEVKLIMSKGSQATYSWQAEGALINCDMHGHGDAGESHTYNKVRGASDDSGTLTAEFVGNHGWFWRNRDKQDLTLTFRVQGEYSELRQAGSGD